MTGSEKDDKIQTSSSNRRISIRTASIRKTDPGARIRILMRHRKGGEDIVAEERQTARLTGRAAGNKRYGNVINSNLF